MQIRLHPHALERLKERGATKAEVEYAVRHGRRSAAKLGRTRFSHTFAYNRLWLGSRYARKRVEALAVAEGEGKWLVVTVIVKYF